MTNYHLTLATTDFKITNEFSSPDIDIFVSDVEDESLFKFHVSYDDIGEEAFLLNRKAARQLANFILFTLDEIDKSNVTE